MDPNQVGPPGLFEGESAQRAGWDLQRLGRGEWFIAPGCEALGVLHGHETAVDPFTVPRLLSGAADFLQATV